MRVRIPPPASRESPHGSARSVGCAGDVVLTTDSYTTDAGLRALRRARGRWRCARALARSCACDDLRFDVIESERLLLVPWNADYDEQFAALCADPQAMRFITRGRPLPREIVDEILDRTREMWRQHGFGPFAEIEKRSGNWIGRIGLNLPRLAVAGQVGGGVRAAPPGMGSRLCHRGCASNAPLRVGRDTAQPNHQRRRCQPPRVTARDGKVRHGVPGRSHLARHNGRLVRNRPSEGLAGARWRCGPSLRLCENRDRPCRRSSRPQRVSLSRRPRPTHAALRP